MERLAGVNGGNAGNIKKCVFNIHNLVSHHKGKVKIFISLLAGRPYCAVLMNKCSGGACFIGGLCLSGKTKE